MLCGATGSTRASSLPRLAAMSYLIRSAFAFFIVLGGCVSSEHEPWITRGLNTTPAEVHDKFTLERTACYGVCPVYDVTVDDHDYLQFRGKQFVAEEGGSVASPLPRGSYKKLQAIAAAHQFDAFNTAYPNVDGSNCPQLSTDSPTIIVGFRQGAEARTVRVDEGCAGFEGRERFYAMLSAMEAVLDIEEFVGPREAFFADDEQAAADHPDE